jgi:hypothetical protein
MCSCPPSCPCPCPIPPGSRIKTSSASYQPFTREHAPFVPFAYALSLLQSLRHALSCICAPFIASRHPSSDDLAARVVTASSIASALHCQTTPRDPQTGRHFVSLLTSVDASTLLDIQRILLSFFLPTTPAARLLPQACALSAYCFLCLPAY